MCPCLNHGHDLRDFNYIICITPMKKTLNLQEFRKVCRVGMKFKFGIKDGGSEFEINGFDENCYYFEGGEYSSFHNTRHVITITNTPKITWDNLREGDVLRIKNPENTPHMLETVWARINNVVIMPSGTFWLYDLHQTYKIYQPDTIEEKPKPLLCDRCEDRWMEAEHAKRDAECRAMSSDQ